jgi:hypothetical protein
VTAAVLLAVLGATYYLTVEPAPLVGILWRADLSAERRVELERRFLLINPAPYRDRLVYHLLDTSRDNLEALVREDDVRDTDGISREDFSLPPDYRYSSSWMWAVHRLPVLRVPGVVEGMTGASAVTLLVSVAAIVRALRRSNEARFEPRGWSPR